MEKYLTPKDAAALIGFSTHWLDAKRKRGGGPPYIRVGRCVRYPLRELIAWMDAHGLVWSTAEYGNTVVVRRGSAAHRARQIEINGIQPTPLPPVRPLTHGKTSVSDGKTAGGPVAPPAGAA